MQLSEYLHDPTEYGLHINTHVSLWLHSLSYDNMPLLVQAFGFVIVTEEIHEEFDVFVASMPLLTHVRLLLAVWSITVVLEYVHEAYSRLCCKLVHK